MCALVILLYYRLLSLFETFNYVASYTLLMPVCILAMVRTQKTATRKELCIAFIPVNKLSLIAETVSRYFTVSTILKVQHDLIQVKLS